MEVGVYRNHPTLVTDFNDLYFIWRVSMQGSAFLWSCWYCCPYWWL